MPSPEAKIRLFISYRRHDLASQALRLRDALRRDARVADVFLDVDDIPGGDTWLRRITDALARAHCVLCLIGPAFRPERLSDQRDVVRFELLYRRLPLLPLLFEAGMPDDRCLPFRLRARLSVVNALTMSNSVKTDAVLEAVHRVLEDHERRKGPRRLALLAVVAALLAVIIFRVFHRWIGDPVAMWAWLVACLLTFGIALYVAVQGVRRGYLADALAAGLVGALVLLSPAGDGLFTAGLFLPIAVWTARLRA